MNNNQKISEMRKIALYAARGYLRLQGINPVDATPNDALAAIEDICRTDDSLTVYVWYKQCYSENQVRLFRREWKEWVEIRRKINEIAQAGENAYVSNNLPDLKNAFMKLEEIIAPAPLAPAAPVPVAVEDDKFEVTGWDEPTQEEVARFWSDEAADERADVIREARYGKQL